MTLKYWIKIVQFKLECVSYLCVLCVCVCLREGGGLVEGRNIERGSLRFSLQRCILGNFYMQWIHVNQRNRVDYHMAAIRGVCLTRRANQAGRPPRDCLQRRLDYCYSVNIINNNIIMRKRGGTEVQWWWNFWVSCQNCCTVTVCFCDRAAAKTDR